MGLSVAVQQRASRCRRMFLRDVIAGLRTTPKSLPCKYFYDQRGSELFDRICQLDEYYLTRAELALMDQFAPRWERKSAPARCWSSLAAAAALKLGTCWTGCPMSAAYVPVDISGEHLQQTAAELARDYPRIEILPVCADFTQDFALPSRPRRTATHAAVYFPGSTIGNFMPDRAVELLRRIAQMCGTGGGLLIGIDLKKDAATIEAAYNDRLGVTAEFNLNLLRRINRELGADFDLDQFFHQARYNARAGPSGNVPGQPLRADGHARRRNHRVRFGRNDLHGVFAQIHRGGIRRSCGRRRTDAPQGMDGQKREQFAVLHFAVLQSTVLANTVLPSTVLDRAVAE